MSILSVRFNSQALSRPSTFNLILPDDAPSWFLKNNPHYSRPAKTLVLLHGFGEDHNTWITDFNIVELAYKNNLAIVLPNGENSFYVDAPGTGRKFATLIGQEIIDYIRRNFNLAKKMKDTFIAGFSMGGYGSLHIALTYPNTFNASAAFSSANIKKEMMGFTPGHDNETENLDYYKSVFGDLDKIEQSRNSLEYQIKELKKDQERIPPLYLACGTEDFLLEINRNLNRFLTEKKVPHQYYESAGRHMMKFWGEYIVKAVEWMLSL